MFKKTKQRTKVSFMVWRKCSANSLVKRDVKTFACISCQLAACGNHTQRHNVLRKIMKLNPDYKKVKRPQRPKRRNISCYGWLVPVFWCRLAYTGNVGTKDFLFKLLETTSGTRTCSLLVETSVKGYWLPLYLVTYKENSSFCSNYVQIECFKPWT